MSQLILANSYWTTPLSSMPFINRERDILLQLPLHPNPSQLPLELLALLENPQLKEIKEQNLHIHAAIECNQLVEKSQAIIALQTYLNLLASELKNKVDSGWVLLEGWLYEPRQKLLQHYKPKNAVSIELISSKFI